MRLAGIATYDGPSLWAKVPIVRLRLEFAEPPAAGEASWDRCLAELTTVLPDAAAAWRQLVERHSVDLDDPALRVALLVAVVAVGLQRMVGPEVQIVRAIPVAPGKGLYDCVFEQEDSRSGSAAGRLAVRVLQELAHRSGLLAAEPLGSSDLRGPIADFAAGAPRMLIDQTTRAFVRLARQRGIPWRRIDPGTRTVRLGFGCKAVQVMETVTGGTCAVAAEIAGDKGLTSQILSHNGLPVPPHAVAQSWEQVRGAARRIGYPLVVKPTGAGKGRGVTVDIRSDDELMQAFNDARRHGDSVIVERFLAGNDHRLLIVDGRLLAAARRIPGGVTGDGRRTVAELVEMENRDPRRGHGFQKVMNRLELNAEAERVLAAVGMTPDSVPAEGQWIALRRTANISTGGTALDVTATVHPDNRAVAERAARVVGLDVAGIDFLTPDIGRSYREVGGAILEVNRGPGLRPHWLANPRQDVVAPLLERLIPAEQDGRIPIAAITGTNGKTTTCLMVERIFARAGRQVGLASTSGVRIAGVWRSDEDLAGGRGHAMVLSSPDVEVAVLETARGGIIRRGLSFDRAAVGAVLNVTDDHLGLTGVSTLDEMAIVKGLVVETASELAVLNAEDPRCLAMAPRSAAKRLCYVSLDPGNPAFAAQVETGEMGVALHHSSGKEEIALFDRGTIRPIVAIGEIPATFGGHARFNVQNALFATAIASGLGASDGEIAAGLASFDSSFECNPGRFNIRDIDGFRIAVDYAHNEAKFRAVASLVAALEVSGERLCAVCAAGDRSDAQLARMTRALAGSFDRFLVFESKNLRGREAGVVPALLRQALIEAGVSAERISQHESSRAAAEALLAGRRNGDFALLIADDVIANWRQVAEWPA